MDHKQSSSHYISIDTTGYCQLTITVNSTITSPQSHTSSLPYPQLLAPTTTCNSSQSSPAKIHISCYHNHHSNSPSSPAASPPHISPLPPPQSPAPTIIHHLHLQLQSTTARPPPLHAKFTISSNTITPNHIEENYLSIVVLSGIGE